MMSDEEFDKHAFKSSDKVIFLGDVFRIVQIDFEERLIGIHEFLDDATVSFIDAGSVELLKDR